MKNIQFILCYLLPFFFCVYSNAQTVNITKLLELQKSPQIVIQDYLETNNWKLDHIRTLKEVDSSIFSSSVIPVLKKAQKENSKLKKIDVNDAAWIKYTSKIDLEINGTNYLNSITIVQPSYFKFSAIDLNKRNALFQKFHIVVDFTYFGDSIHTKVLKEIAALRISESSSSSKTYPDELTKITRIYKLNTQVIELTTYFYKLSNYATMYTLRVSSKDDFNYSLTF